MHMRFAVMLLAFISLVGAGAASAETGEFTVRIEPGLSSLFLEPEDTARAAARIDVRDRSSDTRNLDIRTVPQGAQVYVNQDYLGRGPTRLENLESGTYRIRVSAPGYYTARYSIRLGEPRTAIIEIELRRITGYLSLAANVPNTQFFVDGELTESRLVELPVGVYTLRARRFGYHDIQRRVQINENATTVAHAELSEAPFELHRLRLNRKRLNPANPGILGTVQISFEATNVGSGRLEVLDQDRNRVWSHSFARFERRENAISWDGRDSEGVRVPDGNYRVRLIGFEPDGTPTSEQQQRLRIDSAHTLRYRSSWSGAPGLLFAPNSEVLPTRAFQFASMALGHRDWFSDVSRTRIPFHAALRVGLPYELELGGHGTAYAHDEFDRNYLSGTVYLRRGYSLPERPWFAGAATLSGTLQTYPEDSAYRTPDTAGNPPGVKLSTPFELRFSTVRFVATPELAFSPARPWYGEALEADPELGAWAYLRTGAYLDIGSFQTGVSTALRSEPLGEGAVALDLPVSTGLEAHLMIPRTLMVVSAYAAAELESLSDYYLLGGIGLGFLY